MVSTGASVALANEAAHAHPCDEVTSIGIGGRLVHDATVYA